MNKLIGAALLVTGCSAFAAEPFTEHTWRLGEDETSPPATLADAAWLAGSWTGTAFGKRFEEVWNPASAGSMVGLFKLYDDDGVAFYEIMLLDDRDGTLSLKVRHFNADFTAWEDKDEFVDFRLAAVEDGALHFNGLSFYRDGDDAIDGWLVMRRGKEVKEQHLRYTRVTGADCRATP